MAAIVRPDLLHHMNTQFSPSLLRAADVPVYQLRQNPGEFVVTFPQAFHAGFSYGFNVGEAVNFATTDWYAPGKCAPGLLASPPTIHSHFQPTTHTVQDRPWRV